MNSKDYYVEGKYRCNHPESDFENTSTNPIEMKKEYFTEYTHRNETANFQYNVWENSDNTTSNNLSSSSYSNNNYSSSYAQKDRNYYASKNIYNKRTSKKNNYALIIIVLIYFGIPTIMAILSAFGEMLDSIL